MDSEKNNILIVGNDAAASALAKKFSQYTEIGNIFITNSETYKTETYETVDIRENDLTGLLKFALENDIKLTVPISIKALKSDIVSFFQLNGQNIFGPAESACTNFINKIYCKKFLYKCRAQGTKFAIHSKYSQALDYIKNSTLPVLISTCEADETCVDIKLCTTLRNAQENLELLFYNGETDVLIQEYPYGTCFTAYYITDGYSAVLLNTARNFKFENPDFSEKYTNGIGAYVPEYRLSPIVRERLQNIVTNILQCLNKQDTTYTGIIGLECVLTKDDRFYVQDIKTFLQNYDASAVLKLCEDNLYNIMDSCINGFFSDEYVQIKTSSFSSVSISVQTLQENKIELSNINKDIDLYDIKYKDGRFYTSNGTTFVISKVGSTLTKAKEDLKECLKDIENLNIKYRKDICDSIKG